jgi:3-dehydroquinate synthase
MQEETLEMDSGKGKVYLGDNSLADFCTSLAGISGKILVVCDPNTVRACYPAVADLLPGHGLHTLGLAGEEAKNILECVKIWNRLTELGFDRGDCLVNLGGGVVTDLGGFAASTYKRGIRFYHVPTTLLAMADAAIGGKTGINLQGFKNQVGSFQNPKAVVIHPPFLESLSEREIRSGYAEVLKHYLIHDASAWRNAAALLDLPMNWDGIVRSAVKIKLHFTEADPTEKGIRKALNFGHTIGHAVESYFLAKPIGAQLLHGEAIAIGMVCEAYLSMQRQLISLDAFTSIWETISKVFGRVDIGAETIPDIGKICLQDKKNEGGRVNATLLQDIGSYLLDQWLELPDIEGSLVAYSKGFPTLY